MSINELKKLSPREVGKFMSKTTAKEIKEILNNENLGGGLSKYNKDTLVDILLDLIYGTNDSGLMGTLKPKKVKKNKKKIEIKKDKKKEKDILLEEIPKIAKDIMNNLTIDPEQYYKEQLEHYEDEHSSLGAYGEIIENSFRIPFFRIKAQGILLDKVEEVTKIKTINYILDYDDDIDKVIEEATFKMGKVIYKQLVKYFHPDKVTGDVKKFRDIQEDWESFKNQNKINID